MCVLNFAGPQTLYICPHLCWSPDPIYVLIFAGPQTYVCPHLCWSPDPMYVLIFAGPQTLCVSSSLLVPRPCVSLVPRPVCSHLCWFPRFYVFRHICWSPDPMCVLIFAGPQTLNITILFYKCRAFGKLYVHSVNPIP